MSSAPPRSPGCTARDPAECPALVEHHHAAGDLARRECLEAVVDLVERVGAAHELVELEPALEIELDETREVDGRAHRAVHGALQRLLLERHHVGRDGGAHGHGGHAHDHRHAAGPDGVEDLERGLLAADGVERVVDAAAFRQLVHPLHDVVLLAVHGVGRPELLGVAELVVEEIASHDHARAGQPRALHHVEPDAATADHEHGGARLHARARGDRAYSGGHAAAHERGLGPRHLLANGHQHFRGTDHRLREGADARHLVHVLGLVTEAVAAVEHGPAHRLVSVTEDGAPEGAVEAAATLRTEGEDDVVARLHVLHAGRHLLHDTRRLVPENHGQGKLPVAVHDVPVAVAHPGRLDAHARFPRLRSLLLEVHDSEWGVGLVEDGGSHGSLLSSIA